MLTRRVCHLSMVAGFFLAVSSGQTLKTGEPAPPLKLEQTIPAGMDTSWAALRGKPVVIEFWATWCGNCVAQTPHMNSLVKAFPGIQFISVSDEPASVVQPFLAKHPIAGWVGIDHENATFKAYDVEARPQTLLVDKDGVLRGILYPSQVSEPVLMDLLAGKPVRADRLNARLRMLENTQADPVFAVMLRPSDKQKPGGIFGVDPGKLQGENLALKVALAYAYSVGERRLVGPDELLNARYDFCVVLPDGVSGDAEFLRVMLEKSFHLKIRRVAKEMDAMVLRLYGEKPRESPGMWPMSQLAGSLERRLNRAVVDETGLEGRYKFFALPETEEGIRQALRSELGIEMVAERRPVEMVTIESFELPAFRVSLPGR